MNHIIIVPYWVHNGTVILVSNLIFITICVIFYHLVGRGFTGKVFRKCLKSTFLKIRKKFGVDVDLKTDIKGTFKGLELAHLTLT